MLSHFIRAVAYQILSYIAQRSREEGVPPGNPADLPLWLQHLIEGYWDIVYLYRHGLPKIPDIEIDGPSPFSLQPHPDPLPMRGSLIRDSLLLDVFEHALGDPNPQPSSLIKLLGNKQIRITAARNLRDHFKKAIPQLEAEAKRLEKLMEKRQ